MCASRLRVWLPAVLLSSVIGLVGCTQTSPSYSAPESGPAGDGPAPAVTTVPSEAGPTTDRQVARTAALSLRCADLNATAEQLRQLAESMGGYVASESIWTSANTASGNSRIVLSVPSENLDRFLTEAAKLGELVTRSVTARDVTEQVVDVDARIRTLRASIDRIRALMDKAGSVTEIARVEEELTRRQSELESLLAKQKALRNQVERAPVTVTLLRTGQSDTTQNPLLIGLSQGWDALQNSIAALFVLIGGLLPFALLAGAIGWPIVRRYRRRAAARKAASAEPRADAADEARTSGESAGEQPEPADHDGGDQSEQHRSDAGSA